MSWRWRWRWRAKDLQMHFKAPRREGCVPTCYLVICCVVWSCVVTVDRAGSRVSGFFTEGWPRRIDWILEDYSLDILGSAVK
jgi:hypothetical protein